MAAKEIAPREEVTTAVSLTASYATQGDKLKLAFMIFDSGNGVIYTKEGTEILRANHMASCDAEVARKRRSCSRRTRMRWVRSTSLSVVSKDTNIRDTAPASK